MMLRLVSMAVLTAALSIPAIAQQRETASPEMRQQVEAVAMKWADAVSKGDVKGAEALFAPDAITVTPMGVAHSAQQRDEEFEKVHQMGLTLRVKVAEVQSLSGGHAALATGPYVADFTANPQASHVEGNWLQLLEHEGGTWKIRVSTATRLSTPAPATGTTTK